MKSIEEDSVPETMELNKSHENERKGDDFLFLFSYSIFLLDYCYKFFLSLCERLDYFYAGS